MDHLNLTHENIVKWLNPAQNLNEFSGMIHHFRMNIFQWILPAWACARNMLTTVKLLNPSISAKNKWMDGGLGWCGLIFGVVESKNLQNKSLKQP